MIEALMGAHRRICGSTATVGSSIIASDFLLALDNSKQCTYDERCTIAAECGTICPAVGIFEQYTIAAELKIVTRFDGCLVFEQFT